MSTSRRDTLAMLCIVLLIVPNAAWAAAVPAAVAATPPVETAPRPAERIDEPLAVVAARLGIMQRLIEVGRSPEEARRIAAALTPEDLAVLAANPAMMQEAGEANAQMTSLILAGLVIGGLVALLLTADSGFAVQ